MSSASALTPEIIQHATTFLTVWWTPAMILAYLIGLVLFASGLMKLARGEKLGAGIAIIVIAAIMLGLPGFLNLMSGSFFAVAAPDGLHYVAPQGLKNAGLITLCIRGVQLMGLLALVRSLLFFKDYANEQQSQLLYQGCSFFFGSLACINIVQLLDYFGDWFGGDINFIVDMLI